VLPMPPHELRELVGTTDESMFDNPDGSMVFPYIPAELFDSVVDFGCGCGRVARMLVQQRPRPRRYVGVDLHRGMVAWAQRNLAPCAPGFEFVHHDVRMDLFNPGDKPEVLPLPVPDDFATLVIAISVFTHIVERNVEFYVRELRRVMRPNAALLSTWFLFDKSEFPMMQDSQNALYINDADPTNATIFDRTWLRDMMRDAGLVLAHVEPPVVRGHQWWLVWRPERAGVTEVDIPADAAPRGRVLSAASPVGASRRGVEE
jgi:SAM-dependent methyltransferase